MPGGRAVLIRESYERWNAGDFTPAAELSPAFEFHPPPDLPGEDVYRGPEALAAFAAAVAEAFQPLQVEIVEIAEHGEDVLAHVRLAASGRGSGVTVERDEFHVASFDGMIMRSFRCFASESEARAAVRE
jgi:hypothetical protein